MLDYKRVWRIVIVRIISTEIPTYVIETLQSIIFFLYLAYAVLP